MSVKTIADFSGGGLTERTSICRCLVPIHGNGNCDHRPSLRESNGRDKVLVTLLRRL